MFPSNGSLYQLINVIGYNFSNIVACILFCDSEINSKSRFRFLYWDCDMINSELNIFDTTFIVCDVETTGMSPVNNRITEVALIKVHNGEITDKFSTLINPQQYIPREITNLRRQFSNLQLQRTFCRP